MDIKKIQKDKEPYKYFLHIYEDAYKCGQKNI